MVLFVCRACRRGPLRLSRTLHACRSPRTQVMKELFLIDMKHSELLFHCFRMNFLTFGSVTLTWGTLDCCNHPLHWMCVTAWAVQSGGYVNSHVITWPTHRGSNLSIRAAAINCGWIVEILSCLLGSWRMIKIMLVNKLFKVWLMCMPIHSLWILNIETWNFFLKPRGWEHWRHAWFLLQWVVLRSVYLAKLHDWKKYCDVGFRNLRDHRLCPTLYK